MSAAEEYALKVVKGQIVVGELMLLACKRFLNDLNRDDIWFDEEEGNRVVNFFENYLCHHEGEWAGKPLLLELWQKFILMQVFGWKMSTGKRRIRSCYIQIARKNGKTAMLAGVANYHLFADRENSPQILVGSNNEDQAKLCSTSAGHMIEKSPKLKKLVKRGDLDIYKYRGKVKAINYRKKNGLLEAMTADPTTKDGFNPSLGIVDEYHEASDDLLLNVIESGQGARSEPLLMVITTAGFSKQGPCYSQLRKVSIDILKGHKTDDTHLAFIYEPDEKDDWEDPQTWRKSSPNLGVSVNEGWLKARYLKAKNEGSSKEVDFKTKNLNIWTDAPATWIQDKIVKANSKGIIKEEDLKGVKCYGGLDIGSSGDLTAFARVYINDEGNPFAVKMMFWIPEEKLKSVSNEGNYHQWVNDGWMKVMPGRVIKNDQVAFDILEAIIDDDFQSMAYDPYKADHGIIQTLQDHEIECNHLGQSTKFLGVPTSQLESLVNEEKLEMFSNPVLEWMFGNVVTFTDTSGNIKPDKKRSENKIDGISALVNAIGEWITFKDEENTVDVWTM